MEYQTDKKQGKHILNPLRRCHSIAPRIDNKRTLVFSLQSGADVELTDGPASDPDDTLVTIVGTWKSIEDALEYLTETVYNVRWRFFFSSILSLLNEGEVYICDGSTVLFIFCRSLCNSIDRTEQSLRTDNWKQWP